jgi:hypothetical protein
MANYREGVWRISMVLSVLGFFWGLHWSYREWPRIEQHRRLVDSERKVQALSLSEQVSTEKVRQDIFDTISIGKTQAPAPEPPAWYLFPTWYASLIAVPFFAWLAPLALYRVVRWVAEGFVHTGK